MIGRLLGGGPIAGESLGEGAAVTGDLAVTESGADTFAGTGSLSGGITGSVSATESGSDTIEAAGVVPVAGALAVTESGADTAALAGVVAVEGSLSVTESGSDTFDAEGSATNPTGTMDAAEGGADTAQILGAGVNLNPRRHAGTRKNYIIKGQKYALNDYELQTVVQQMLNEVKRPDVQVVDRQEVKQISRKVWKRIKESLDTMASLERVESVIEQNVIQMDDEDDEELLLLL